MIAAGRRRVAAPGGADLLVDLREGEGTPVLLLGSLASDHRMWGPVRDGLDAPSVAVDARGHGASPPVGGTATVEDYGRDALAVLDALGIDRAVICGLSLGGLAAIWLAAEAAERVAALVLANTALSFPPPAMWADRARQAREQGMAALVEPTLGRWLTDAFRADRPDIAALVRDMVGGTHPEGYAAAAAALAAADMAAAASRVTCPVTVIAGRHDAATPPARAEEIAAAIPQARLVTLDAAHVSALERPEAFARAVREAAREAGAAAGLSRAT